MEKALTKNRTLVVAFALAAALHGLLLTIPAARKAVVQVVTSPSVTVRLLKPAPAALPPSPLEVPAAKIEPLPVEEPPPRATRTPAESEPVPAPAESEPAARISAGRILLDLEERRKNDPLAPGRVEDGPAPAYRRHTGPSLDEVLKPPSLQLPFEDTRMYLVDSYDPGLLGGIDRFFDSVTVPFGFTTKNNTRIQCAWTLIVAGCVWGDAGYFYSKQEARRRE